MPSKPFLHLCAALALVLGLWAQSGETVTHPFAGITHIERQDSSPRLVRMHVLLVQLDTPGLKFFVTPHAGPLDTLKQTTLEFITGNGAQIAINAHFFEPWPPPSPDPGTADLVGFAASNGQAYSPFVANPPKPHAIRPDAPAINFGPTNRATIVHRNPADPSGLSVVEPVKLHSAIAGNEQLLTAGQVTAGTGKWDNTPNPLTVIGLAGDSRLVVLVVDGRQPGISEGLSTNEAAELLRRDYGVTDALNLDGGGSSTLCMADPLPRVANHPPGALRSVGSNLAIFAPPATPSVRPAVGASSPAPQSPVRNAVVITALLAVFILWRWAGSSRRKS